MNVQQLVSRLESGTISLPEFQRGYVWNNPKVTALMESLYRDYPIGMITVWDTRADDGQHRQLIVDGQQRLGSIYACYTNEIPQMHQLAAKKPPVGLYFNLNTEDFKFATQRERNREPMWISVSKVLSGGEQEDLEWRQQIQASDNFDSKKQLTYDQRVSAVRTIAKKDIPIEEIASNRTVNEVQEMFDRINRLGRKPTRGELEMARLCVIWDQAKPTIKAETDKWQATLLRRVINADTIIRSMTAVYTGGYKSTGLTATKAAELQSAFNVVTQTHETMFNSLTKQLRMHEDNAIQAIQTFTIIAKYLSKNRGQFPSKSEEAKALAYHLTSTGLGVYHGSTDSQIDQDLAAVDQADVWDELLAKATAKIGNPIFEASRLVFGRAGRSRAYGMVHVLQKQPHVCDWLSKKAIRDYDHQDLEKHHIFPTYHLQNAGVPQTEIDDIANMALISAETNGILTHRPPDDYLREIDDDDNSMLASHFIPRDRDLWKIDNYRAFLTARRENIAKGANDLLDKLRSGSFG